MRVERQHELRGFALGPTDWFLVLNESERKALRRAAAIAEEMNRRMGVADDDVAKLEMFATDVAAVARWRVESPE